MTKEYIDRLIRLAEEIDDNTGDILGDMDSKQVKWMSKIHFLIGYIMALKENKKG